MLTPHMIHSAGFNEKKAVYIRIATLHTYIHTYIHTYTMNKSKQTTHAHTSYDTLCRFSANKAAILPSLFLGARIEACTKASKRAIHRARASFSSRCCVLTQSCAHESAVSRTAFVCVYTYVSVCMYIYIFIYACIYVFIYVCMYTHFHYVCAYDVLLTNMYIQMCDPQSTCLFFVALLCSYAKLCA